MKYDWTSIIDRNGLDAIAFDAVGREGSGFIAPKEGFDIIPMWVADMNFRTCPAIQREIIRRAQHPCFGYYYPRDEYYGAIISWQKTQHGSDVRTENLSYVNGVLGGVITALNTFCSRGDSVLIHKPTYTGFSGVLANNGYNIIRTELKKDEKGIYRMDLEETERLIRDNRIHAAVLCSPHNPCGRVWEREELAALFEIFEKYGVKVAADEIWSDVIMNGYEHIPTQSVSAYARENTVAFYSVSKTFNLSGLVSAYAVIYNKTLHDRFEKEASLSHFNSMNMLSMYANIGAYSDEGREWVKELREVLTANADYAASFINERFCGVNVTKPQGTYMLFPDLSDYCAETGRKLEDVIRSCHKVGVYVIDGRPFFGPCHLRINVASPFSRISEAFDRLEKYVFN